MDEWAWSNGGMILTGEKWSAGRKTLYSVGGRWMNEYGAMVEWYWQGKTEVLGEKHYTAWVVDGWMSMAQWWNDAERRNTSRYKILSQCHIIHYKCHMAWLGIQSCSSHCDAFPNYNIPQIFCEHILFSGPIHMHTLSHTHTHIHTTSEC